jgi:hypothetical protein
MTNIRNQRRAGISITGTATWRSSGYEGLVLGAGDRGNWLLIVRRVCGARGYIRRRRRFNDAYLGVSGISSSQRFDYEVSSVYFDCVTRSFRG